MCFFLETHKGECIGEDFGGHFMQIIMGYVSYPANTPAPRA